MIEKKSRFEDCNKLNSSKTIVKCVKTQFVVASNNC